MFEALLENYETLAYPVAFFGAIGVIGFCEILFPRRRLAVPFLLRWTSAFCLTAINTALHRYALPLLGIPLAFWLADRGIGLFNAFEAPLWLAVFISFWVLDLSKWTQHWLLHRVPFLWLLHRTHHVDLDYDFTTGLRFHPADALFTASLHLATIALLGAPVEAVVLSELITVVMAAFAHANIKIPLRLDRYLRLLLVTPDVHRVHHSSRPGETNSNFGGLITWWDRLFGTYKDQPEAGHEGMTIGLEEFRDPKHLHVHWVLLNPLLAPERPAERPAEPGEERRRPVGEPRSAA